MDLREHWQAFLQRNSDAQIIVDRVAERTGFCDDEVLFYLLGMWAMRNLTPPKTDEFLHESSNIN